MLSHYSTMVLIHFVAYRHSPSTLPHNENPQRGHQLVQFVDSVGWARLLESPQ